MWALAYATRFLNCLLFSAGFWAAIRPWRSLRARIWCTVLDETGDAGVHSSWSCETVDMGLVLTVGPASCCLKQLSCAVCLTRVYHGHCESLGNLLVALANPLHLPFRHIEDVCNFSRRLGLESWWSALWFLVWSWACWQKQCWALTDDLKFHISAFIAQSYLQLTNQAPCLFLPYSLKPRIWSWPLRQDFGPAKTGLLIIINL